MPPILATLVPDFMLLAIGATLRRGFAPDFWKGLDRLNFWLLFPALLFAAALGSAPRGSDLVVIGLGTWAIMGLGCLLGWFIRPLGPERFLDFAGMWQTTWRFNTALALVAVQVLPAEYRGLMAIAIGTGVPVANIMAVWALSRGQADGWGATLRQIVSNPFLLASLGGIVCGTFGVAPPAALMGAIERLAEAAIPVALLSIGAALNLRALARIGAFNACANAIRLLALPLVTLAIASLLPLDPGQVAVLTLFAALPTTTAAHVLASVYGADREAVATLIAQSTIFGCATLPLWLYLVA